MHYPRVARLRSPEEFQEHLDRSGIALPFDRTMESTSILNSPIERKNGAIGNRFTILPMEGWDGTKDGKPSELTVRRWQNFGCSGAKLIWGGEAVAVRQDGRANPRQLLMTEENLPAIVDLRCQLLPSPLLF